MAININNPQQNQQVQTQGAQKPQGSGFTNLQQIIQANRNNRLGQAVGQGLQQQTSQVKSGVQSAQTQFGQGLQKSQEQLSKDKQESQSALSQIAANYSNQPAAPTQQTQSATPAVQNVQQTQQAVPQTQAGAVSPVYTDAQQGLAQASQFNGAPAPAAPQQDQSGLNLPGNFLQTFQRLGRADYQGPQGLENYDQLRAQAQSAQSLGQAVIDPNARRGVLQQFVGGPTYTQGQSKLDNLILGQTGGQDLSLARRGTQGLSRNVEQAGSQAQTQADLQRQAAQQASQQTRADVLGTTGKVDAALQSRADTLKQQNEGLYNQLKTAATSGNLQGENLEKAKQLLGFTSDKFISSQDIASALGTFDPTAINKGAVSSQGDLARIRALEQIGQVSGAGYQSGIKDTDIGKDQSKLGLNVNSQQLLDTQRQNEQAYNQALNPIQNELNLQQQAQTAYQGYADTTRAYNAAIQKAQNNPYDTQAQAAVQQLKGQLDTAKQRVSSVSQQYSPLGDMGKTLKGGGYNMEQGFVPDEYLNDYSQFLQHPELQNFQRDESKHVQAGKATDADIAAAQYAALTNKQRASSAALEQLKQKYNYYGLGGAPQQQNTPLSDLYGAKDFTADELKNQAFGGFAYGSGGIT